MTLFSVMVILPAAVFGILIVRGLRGEQVRLDYEKGVRQQQIVQLAQADLTSWLFSAALDGARSLALLRFEVQGDQIVFSEVQLSLPASGSPGQKPFDAARSDTPVTPQLIADQDLPRILAFRRDVSTGRNAGAQYFRQL